MESQKRNASIRLYSIAVFLVLIMSTHTIVVTATRNTACPLENPNFGTNYGVDGAIADGSSYPNMLYYFGANQGPKSWGECYRSCQEWPRPGGTLCHPRNGEQGSCAYWSWTSGSGCRLYGCGVCRSFSSYTPTSYLPQLGYGQRHCSGGGPKWKQCVGGVKGDPHYTGGDRSHFEFTGVPGKSYCLVSDSDVHVNVFYDGRFGVWGDNAHKPLTWIRKVGILWGKHTVVLEARQGSEWRYQSGYMSQIVVDGERVNLEKEGDMAELEDGQIQISWAAAKQHNGDDEIDVYHVTVADKLKMIVKVRPEVAHLRTNEDGVVHFTLEFPVVHLSDDAHGVLGQTYRSDHKDRRSKHESEFNDLLQVHVIRGENAEGFLDGSSQDYVTSDLLKSDCAFARFSHNVEKSDEKIVLYRKLLR